MTFVVQIVLKLRELSHVLRNDIAKPSGTTLEDERTADAFARDTLIPVCISELSILFTLPLHHKRDCAESSQQRQCQQSNGSIVSCRG